MLPMLIRPLREPLPTQQASGSWGRVSPAAPCCDLPPPHYSSPLGFYIFPCCSVLPPKLLSTALPWPAILPSLCFMIFLAAWPYQLMPELRLHSWDKPKLDSKHQSSCRGGPAQGKTMQWLQHVPSPGSPNINLVSLGH